MLRIYADFNCIDEDGSIILNTVGSLIDRPIQLSGIVKEIVLPARC